MALQSISGGLWLPAPYIGTTPVVAANTFVIDASGEIAALIFQAPKTGSIDRFDFQVNITNSPDNGLRASLQGVTAAGVPDGTIKGATNNASVTYAHTVTTGWKSTNFAEAASVTRGDLLAAVVDIPTFTVGDNVIVWRVAGLARQEGFPYGISATSTREASYLPNIAIHYTDGYVCVAPQTYLGVDTTNTVAYNSGTGTADEWGMAFSIPFPFKLNAIHANMAAAAGADFSVVVYDSDGSTVLATLTHDGDLVASTSETQHTFFLQSELTLSANTTYRVSIKPTTTNNVTLRYFTFQSAALMSTMEGGSSLYMTSRLDGTGSWTDYNSGTFRRPMISLNLSALSDGVGSGAGVIGS